MAAVDGKERWTHTARHSPSKHRFSAGCALPGAGAAGARRAPPAPTWRSARSNKGRSLLVLASEDVPCRWMRNRRRPRQVPMHQEKQLWLENTEKVQTHRPGLRGSVGWVSSLIHRDIARRRQPIDVSVSHRCFTLCPAPFLSL